MENEIQLTTHALNQEKFLHPPDLHPIEVKEGELHVNKMIVNTHLPREKMLVNDELDICEYIATEPEPQQQELDKLVHMVHRYSDKILSNINPFYLDRTTKCRCKTTC